MSEYVTADDPVWADRLNALYAVAGAIGESVAADGGHFTLVGLTDSGVVHCRLAGACGTCAVATTSTGAGLERILTGRFSWVTAVEVLVEETSSDVSGLGGWIPKRDSYVL